MLRISRGSGRARARAAGRRSYQSEHGALLLLAAADTHRRGFFALSLLDDSRPRASKRASERARTRKTQQPSCLVLQVLLELDAQAAGVCLHVRVFVFACACVFNEGRSCKELIHVRSNVIQ